MSNLERRPVEHVVGGVSAGPALVTATTSTRQVLAPREVPLGGPRAMLVRRTLPHRELRTVGAWCFLDDYGPSEVSGGAGMRVPPHPHTGLQTVTWLLEGVAFHQDSLGCEQVIRPGQLNLMTAGRGISHAETSPADHSGVLRGVQLWVALPDEHRHGDPAFAHHPDLPVYETDGLRATVLVGSVDGATSPARAYTPLVGADVELAGGRGAVLPLEPAFEHALLALSDGLEVDGERLPAASLLYLGRDRERVLLRDVSRRAGSGPDGPAWTGAAAPARALLLGGLPFAEELLMWWNFVGRSHDEVVAARAEWTAAVEGAATRFGQVVGYDGPALPAPELPTSRLRPRRR